ncbi:MAG: flagellar motor switch phosphatase FliY [Limnochordia bacterium]|nr:flagellar motor switch phosphatase FliY [Limnochordia bacterium]
MSRYELTDEHKDIIGEVGNIAMGSAATALSQILQEEVLITTPVVELVKVVDLEEQFPVPCLVCEINYITGLSGSNVLILNQDDAKLIASLMIGEDISNDLQADELALSALGEAMNQMMGSAATAMSKFFATEVIISPPDVQVNLVREGSGFFSEFSGSDDVVEVLFQMTIGDLLESTMVMIIPLEFARSMSDNLLTELTEEPVADPEPKKVELQEITPEPKPVVHSAAIANGGEKMHHQFDFEVLKDTTLKVRVVLGRTEMTMAQILALGKGSIVELDRLEGEPVDVFINEKKVAAGEVVVAGEQLGVRITEFVAEH